MQTFIIYYFQMNISKYQLVRTILHNSNPKQELKNFVEVDYIIDIFSISAIYKFNRYISKMYITVDNMQSVFKSV